MRHSDTQRTPCMYTIIGVVIQAAKCKNQTISKSTYKFISNYYISLIENNVWNNSNC